MNIRKVVAIIVVAGTVIVAPHAQFTTHAQGPGNPGAEEGVRKAAERFYAALNQMFTGDAAPILAAWSHARDVTDMGPFGNRSVGWDQVRQEFEREAKMKMGGKVEPRDMAVGADRDLGYVVCVERGENLSAGGQPVSVEIRSTSIFRLEDGEWKIVHHHTDPAPKLARAAH
jgi:ketosteroid isomerase-like protein